MASSLTFSRSRAAAAGAVSKTAAQMMTSGFPIMASCLTMRAHAQEWIKSKMTPKPLPEALLKTNLASARFRKSPFFEATLRWGVTSFQPYNHTLMPQLYSSEEDECENLRKNVCLWDVSCQRQIEVVGEDALVLAEMLTPRKMGSMKVGEARYAIMTDEEGMVINDPLVLRVDEDRYWFSIADQDMLWWIKGLALGNNLKVKVSEPDISTLAVQGPKSLPLMKELVGDWVEDLKYFRFVEAELAGIPIIVCRSGWSPERGYELLLKDGSQGDALWEKVMTAGGKYGIKPGRPNLIRRVEGGMLSFGVDISPENNVLEIGLPRQWVGPDKAADFMGKDAIKRIEEAGGAKRQIVGLKLPVCAEEDRDFGPMMKPYEVLENGRVVGKVTSLVYSPVLGTHIAIATVMNEMSSAGTELRIDIAGHGCRDAVVQTLPFMPRAG
jgi:aminomethyltransferase